MNRLMDRLSGPSARKFLYLAMRILPSCLLFLSLWEPTMAFGAPGFSELPGLTGDTPADRTQFLSVTRSSAKSIPVGHGRRTLWVYFNPDCSYCHRLWRSLDGVSDLTVYWIPVTFSLKPESLARSAAILSAKDPANALALNEQNFDDLRERGGYPIPPTVPDQAREEVTKNTMLLRLWTGTIATPTLLYRDSRGTINVSIGLPSDISGVISTLAP